MRRSLSTHGCSSPVLCAGFPERRYWATTVSRVVGIVTLHAAGVCINARSSSTSGRVSHRAELVRTEYRPSAKIIWTAGRWHVAARPKARACRAGVWGGFCPGRPQNAVITVIVRSRARSCGHLRSRVRTFCPERASSFCSLTVSQQPTTTLAYVRPVLSTCAGSDTPGLGRRNLSARLQYDDSDPGGFPPFRAFGRCDLCRFADPSSAQESDGVTPIPGGIVKSVPQDNQLERRELQPAGMPARLPRIPTGAVAAFLPLLHYSIIIKAKLVATGWSSRSTRHTYYPA